MIAFISFATIVLLFVVLVLIAKAQELTADLKDGKVSFHSQSKWNGYFLLAFLIFMFVGSAMCFKILMPVMVPMAASEHGVKTDFLFNINMLIIGIVFQYGDPIDRGKEVVHIIARSVPMDMLRI